MKKEWEGGWCEDNKATTQSQTQIPKATFPTTLPSADEPCTHLQAAKASDSTTYKLPTYQWGHEGHVITRRPLKQLFPDDKTTLSQTVQQNLIPPKRRSSSMAAAVGCVSQKRVLEEHSFMLLFQRETTPRSLLELDRPEDPRHASQFAI